MDEKFKCPRCGTILTLKRIIANHYACLNFGCSLNKQLLIHGETTSSGRVLKVYGWVLQRGSLLRQKYEIIQLIGKGGFGATYLARDRSIFNQLRAIKEIPRIFCDEKEDQFLSTLNHPSIPKLYDRFNVGKFHYSVMEFIEGESLTERVRRNSGELPESIAIRLAEGIGNVLSYIHSQKIIHRDLKPDNIIIRKDVSIALIDFGISKKLIYQQGTRQLARAASHFYAPPEQYRAGKGHTDARSDIYAFGAILYFMLTGVEPADALTRDPAKDIMPLPRNLNPKISPKMEHIIIKAMKMQKSDRFRDVQEMLTSFMKNEPLRNESFLALEVPKGLTRTKTFSVRNDDKMKRELIPLSKWISLNKKTIHKKRQKIKLRVSAEKLSIGRYRGSILIQTEQQPSQFIDVSLHVLKPTLSNRLAKMQSLLIILLVSLVTFYLLSSLRP